MIQEMKVRLTGQAPLIMHNGQTANPLNTFARELKKISSKRQKTEADLEQLARIEWYAGLYVKGGKVIIPGIVLEAALINGAKKSKSGKTAQAGLFVQSDMPLEFPHNDLTIDQLWELEEYQFSALVRVQQSRIARMRPKFDTWAITATVQFDDSLFNKSAVRDIIKITGEQVGLCDWRPRFGRFSVEFL